MKIDFMFSVNKFNIEANVNFTDILGCVIQKLLSEQDSLKNVRVNTMKINGKILNPNENFLNLLIKDGDKIIIDSNIKEDIKEKDNLNCNIFEDNIIKIFEERIKKLEYKIDELEKLYYYNHEIENGIILGVSITSNNINKNIQLFYQNEFINYASCIKKIIVDNKTIKDIKNIYKFNQLGEHKIVLEFNREIASCEFMFNECKDIKSINLTYFNSNNIRNMSAMFQECNSLEEIKGFEKFNTENVTEMDYLFNKCIKLKSLDLSNFNTKNVSNMKSMFQCCFELEAIKGLDKFNTEHVVNMEYLFVSCHKLKTLNLSSFNTKRADNLSVMFQNCHELEQIHGLENFSTEKVTDISYMFVDCKKLSVIHLSNFNMQNINSLEHLFWGCKNLKLLEMNLNLQQNTITEGMFDNIDNPVTFIYKDGKNSNLVIREIPKNKNWNVIKI